MNSVCIIGNLYRFYNGTGTTPGKLSQAVQSQRYHHYPRKMAYHHHLPGFPREWFDDLDPDMYVRAFSKFGELTERPAALSQTPQCDSVSLNENGKHFAIWNEIYLNEKKDEIQKSDPYVAVQLSEGIWLKFVANQQTTETFRKKMELWRDVYRIVRTLNYNSHFQHDVSYFMIFVSISDIHLN